MNLVLDAESLYLELLRGVRGLCGPDSQLVGITSGGAWLARRVLTSARRSSSSRRAAARSTSTERNSLPQT